MPHPSPRSVIAWEHGTSGLLQKCMPSLASEPTTGIPNRIIAAGWVIVATDYSFAEKGGPLPVLIGEGEARAELDAVRAARQMPELTLDAQAVVWGHSQRGHAALWTGIIGPRYAPEVKIAGVAAIARRKCGERDRYEPVGGQAAGTLCCAVLQPLLSRPHLRAGTSSRGPCRLTSPLDAPLVAWTTARFAAEPQPSGCSRKSF